MHRLVLDADDPGEPTLNHPTRHPPSLPHASTTKAHPRSRGGENGKVYFVGTATTIIEWGNIRLLTDPNFLPQGDEVHLGPGIKSRRLTDPAISLQEMPPVHLVLLSHYHGDHFDPNVEKSLTRDLPIVTTQHAKRHLTSKGDDSFTQVYALDTYQSMIVEVKSSESSGEKEPAIRITGLPGRHIPPGALSRANDFIQAVPPTNGWMVELGTTTKYHHTEGDFETGYRIYITGDTLMCNDVKEIAEIYAGENIDLMLLHLGGTTIPSPQVPLLMVTMDSDQGVELMEHIRPGITIPIHYDDYDIFTTKLEDIQAAVDEAGLSSKVVYLGRKDEYIFKVR